jgi:hypothetical protein
LALFDNAKPLEAREPVAAITFGAIPTCRHTRNTELTGAGDLSTEEPLTALDDLGAFLVFRNAYRDDSADAEIVLAVVRATVAIAVTAAAVRLLGQPLMPAPCWAGNRVRVRIAGLGAGVVFEDRGNRDRPCSTDQPSQDLTAVQTSAEPLGQFVESCSIHRKRPSLSFRRLTVPMTEPLPRVAILDRCARKCQAIADVYLPPLLHAI